MFISPKIRNLKIGDIITVKVIEQTSTGYLIVEYVGQLLRVKNDTQIQFKAKDRVELRLSSLKPQTFKLMENQEPGKGLKISI